MRPSATLSRMSVVAAAACLWLSPFGAAAAAESGARLGSTNEGAVRARADALIAQMTPAEKAAQLTQYFYMQPVPAANQTALQALATTGVGSLLFVTDPQEVNRLQHIAVETSRLKIPVLFGFDVIHGLHTIFPVPIGLAASWDPELVTQVQAAAASEARAVGVDWTFAPMVDIARDPRWGRIVEGAGEDSYLGSAMAAAQVRGFQGPYLGAAGHIIAGPKHFAGYGAALGGRDYDEVNLSDEELWNVYLPPFKAAVDAGAGNIMSAYMPLNGVPASANRWLLTKVLRETWGFKGFVSSDSGAVVSLVTQGLGADKQDAAIRALNAGIDMEMAPPFGQAAMQLAPTAVETDKIPKAELDDAVRYVLEAKIRMGLFEHPFVDPAKAQAVLNDPAHLNLTRIAAERSAVLLRNSDGLLPLNRKMIHSLAVIGPLADSRRDTLGSWVFPQNGPEAVTVLEGIKAKLSGAVRVDYSEGVRMPSRVYPSPSAGLDRQPPRPPLDESAEIGRAVALARQADVAVLVLGEGRDMTGESASRSSLELPGRQQELLDAVVATGKPVVVVLMSGRPLDLKETTAAAIIEIWYPGSAGGAAVANLLFGDATPGGKLPFTWIRSAAQAPNPYAHLISHDPKHADERYWNGSSAPIYPFGYGLSYTNFRYSNLRIGRSSYAPGEPVNLTVDLQNTGARAGDEVAQLYIHQRWGTSARPIRLLKGFQRVTLTPGESRTLRFTLTDDDLRYWSAATGGWLHDESTFDIWVGGSSTADLAGSFEVKRP